MLDERGRVDQSEAPLKRTIRTSLPLQIGALLHRHGHRRPLAFDHAARQFAGCLAAAIGDDAREHRRLVARSLLQKALAAGRQVMGDVGAPEQV